MDANVKNDSKRDANVKKLLKMDPNVKNYSKWTLTSKMTQNGR